MRQIDRIAYNTAANYIGTGIQATVGVFLIPYIVGRLGREGYGVVVLALTVMGMVELFGMGLSQAVTRHVASGLARGDVTFGNEIYSSSLAWFAGVGLAGAACAIGIGVGFQELFTRVSPDLVPDGRFCMFVMGATILVCLVGDVWRGLLAAMQRYDILNGAGSVRSLVRLLAIVAYFHVAAPTISGVAVIFALTLALERVVWWAACYKVVDGLQASLRLITASGLKKIRDFASFMFLGAVAGLMVSHLLKFLIGRNLGVSQLADYAVGATLMVLANTMVRSFVNVLMPVASKYEGSGDQTGVRNLFEYGTKYGAILALSCMGVTFPFLPAFYRLWMGDDYIRLCGMTWILLGGQAVVSTTVCANQILNGLGKVRFVSLATLGYAIVTMVTVWLYHRFGTAPSLIGTVAIVAAGRVAGNAVILAYGIRVARARPRVVLANVIGVPLLVCGFACLAGHWIAAQAEISSWLELGGWVAVVESGFFTGILVFCVGTEEKEVLWDMLTRFIARVACRRESAG